MTDPTVARVQYCMLHGTSAADLHDALAALQIPGGQPQQPDCIEQVRRAVLYSGCSLEQMRSAFASVGVTGHDPDAAVRELMLRHLKHDDAGVP